MKKIILCLTLLITAHLHAVDIIINNQAEIPTAIAQAAPGDMLILVNGIYSDLLIQFNTNGTIGNPITLRAETPGGVIITGQSKLVLQGDYLIVDGFKFEDALWPASNKSRIVDFYEATHCRLTNCAFFRCGSVDGRHTHIILLLEGSHHNRVDHNYLEDNYGQGIGVYVLPTGINATNTDNKIDHNHINGITPDGEPNGQEPIQIGQDQTTTGNTPVRAIVEYNLIENQPSDADPEMISNKSAENIYRYNTFRNTTGLTREISLRGGSSCIVEGNFCFNVGIRIYGPNHVITNNYIENPVGVIREGIRIPGGTGAGVDGVNYPETQNVLVANNTIINAATYGISIGTQNPNWVHDITLKNNIVSCESGTLFYENAAVANGNIYNANMAHVTNGATAHTTNIPASGILQANPNLVLSGETYHLSNASSPAVDAALVLAEVTIDFDGQNREPLPDIGCDELSNATILHQPLTMGDVGPCWLNGTGCSPLPLELISFQGLIMNGAVNLFWSTASEINAYRFEIEQSTVTKEWNKIGFLANKGNENSITKYTFTHTLPSVGINYYRLKQIDLSGIFEYSAIISVTVSALPQIQLSPNPTTGIIYFSTTNESEIMVIIVDVFGRKVKQQKIVNQEMDLSNLVSGYYFVRLITPSQITTFKVMKK